MNPDALFPSERRCWPRAAIGPPAVGILRTRRPLRGGRKHNRSCFVYVHNITAQGAMVESHLSLAALKSAVLVLLDPLSSEENRHLVSILWTQRYSGRRSFFAGLGFGGADGHEGLEGRDRLKEIGWDGIDFLRSARLLTCLPEEARLPLINALERRDFEEGQRLLAQGGSGDCMLIVQEGTCAVRVEREGRCHQEALVIAGGIVGEMAMLTGEPRSAHIDALSPVVAWELGRQDFERISGDNPDLNLFLTELVTQRFESSVVVADRTIGRYRIHGRIGHGGWGIVYLGTHRTLGMPVAIKMLRHNMAMAPEFRQKFRREAEIVARLRHRNIVQVYDIEECYRTIFIVMEHLEGEALGALLASSGRMPPARAANLLGQACAGLTHAHQQGLVHQDIKPDNMFILPDDHLKILDFGLACTPGEEMFDLNGTLFYAAPEQIEGGPIDPRSDLYALGITAFEMLCGQRPFPEEDLADLMRMHCQCDIPDPARFVPDLPTGLRHFILTCCQRQPERRYPDAGEALADLRRACDGSGLKYPAAPERSMQLTSLFLTHDSGRQEEVDRLVENFQRQAAALGVTLKVAPFSDI